MNLLQTCNVRTKFVQDSSAFGGKRTQHLFQYTQLPNLGGWLGALKCVDFMALLFNLGDI